MSRRWSEITCSLSTSMFIQHGATYHLCVPPRFFLIDAILLELSSACFCLDRTYVPIRPFDEVYSYLIAHNKSHLDYASVPAEAPSDRWTQIMMLKRFVNNLKRSADFTFNIDVRHFTYHSMWMALSREHVKRPDGGQSPKTYNQCTMDDLLTFSQ